MVGREKEKGRREGRQRDGERKRERDRVILVSIKQLNRLRLSIPKL